MDALMARCAILAVAVTAMGASYRSPNFIVEAPTPQLAEQIGKSAEKYRKDLAIEWVGQEMQNWAQPCPITAHVADHLGAGGATSFEFQNGEVYGWRMTIQGSAVRVLDSVLPHEVTHMIFATHFRRPLPRWADEGACTTVEHTSEKTKQQHMLVDFLRTGRGISFSQMFAMREYPSDVMPLYSQGYSVARYLVAQGGKRKFLDYLSDGMRDENWSRATQKFYGYENLAVLQNQWLDWVRQGSKPLAPTAEQAPLVAVNDAASSGRSRPADTPVYRTPGGRPQDVTAALPGPADDGSIYEIAARTSGNSAPQNAGPTRLPRKPAASSAAALNPAADGDDWRPQGKPRPPKSTPAQVAQGTNATDEALAQDSAQPNPQQVTRPQGFERSRQIILEWSKPNGPAAPLAERTAALPGPG